MIFEIFEKIYEKIAYHVDYELDKDGNIIRNEVNAKFGTTKFIYTVLGILIVSSLMLFFVVLNDTLNSERDQRVYENRYDVEQVCISRDNFTECFGFINHGRFRIYVDKSNPVKTLYIKED